MRRKTPNTRSPVVISRALRVACGMIAACMTVSVGLAQYAYDPSNPDEQQGPPGIRYFGSVKDSNGALVPGATIALASDQARFIFVTNEQGRFRGDLPLDVAADKVAAQCWKVGYKALRVTKRPGPAGVKPTVQVDCVLRRVD
jgi:hypothetical protein